MGKKEIPVSHYAKSTKEKCLKFWEDPNDGKNEPSNYALHIERSEFLHTLFVEHKIRKDSSVLEIGCNMGRNLNYLQSKGYKNLSGVEISEKALTCCNEVYPSLGATLYNSPIETIIESFRNDQFSIVFTCAVLMHIHVSSEWVFDEIARIAKKHIILLEDRKRDYQKIFETEKFVQVKTYQCSSYIPIAKKYTARVFERR